MSRPSHHAKSNFDTDWMRDSLCTEAPGLPWTEHHRVPIVSSDLMRFLCSQCPVNLECTIFTRDAEVTAGFWAGATRNPVDEPRGAA